MVYRARNLWVVGVVANLFASFLQPSLALAMSPVPAPPAAPAPQSAVVVPQSGASSTPPAATPPSSQPAPEPSAQAAPQDSQAIAKPAAAVGAVPAGIIVIDNDDDKCAAEIEQSYKWEELPGVPGATRMSIGACFPVRVVSELTSRTARVGDPVEGQLRVDLRLGGTLIAAKGTKVRGHVFSAQPARRILVAELSPRRWWRANGEIGLQFDEIITNDGQHLPLEATPARRSRIVDNEAEGRVMGVNKNGEVACPLSIQLKHQAVHLVIRGAASAGGVFSMGAIPVAYAALGAINPSFAFLHPVGKNVPHRRLKGAAMGFVSGVPGGFLVADSVIRGQEACIKPGDEFLVELKQEFTGEPAGDAEMLPDGSRSVHGEVVRKNVR